MDPDQSRGSGAQPPHPAEAWTVLSYLLSGFLLYGGIGWGVDALLGTRLFLLVGLLAGGATSLYLIYIRYAKS